MPIVSFGPRVRAMFFSQIILSLWTLLNFKKIEDQRKVTLSLQGNLWNIFDVLENLVTFQIPQGACSIYILFALIAKQDYN